MVRKRRFSCFCAVLGRGVVVFGQPVFVRGKKVVAHALNIVHGKFGGGVRVEISRHVYEFLFLLACRFNRHVLHVDVGAVERGALFGKVAHKAGVDTVFIHKAFHFHAGVLRQVGDEPRVEHVAVHFVRHAVRYGIDNRRSEFGAFYMFDIVGCDFGAHFLPTVNLTDASAGIFVERNAETLNQFGIFGFDEKRIVFRIVLTGLCAVVSQMFDILKTNHVVMFL